MKVFTSKNQKIGQKGEYFARKFLVERGFTVIECNYTKKCGEIDIVALFGETIHFIEIKTLTAASFGDVPRETLRTDYINPLENVTRSKLLKMKRTIACYLWERGVPRETPWTVDIVSVIVPRETGGARVSLLRDVVI